MNREEKLWVIARFIKNHKAELQEFMQQQGFDPEQADAVEYLAHEIYIADEGEQEQGE